MLSGLDSIKKKMKPAERYRELGEKARIRMRKHDVHVMHYIWG